MKITLQCKKPACQAAFTTKIECPACGEEEKIELVKHNENFGRDMGSKKTKRRRTD